MIRQIIKSMLRPIVSELLCEQKKPTKIQVAVNPKSIKVKRKRFNNKTIYQQIAEKFGVTPRYVGKIARSERDPKRLSGIGIQIKLELEQLASSN